MIFRRLNDRYSEVAKTWLAHAAVLLGGGPSLTQDQIAQVEAARHADQVRVIAVNDAYLLAPWADVNYFADSHWWKWHSEGIAKPQLGLNAQDVKQRFAAFAGEKCSIESSGGNITDERVHLLRNRNFPYHSQGLSLDPRSLVTGRNGGFQALNLAVLAGAKKIILLGYDGAPDKEGKTHFHGGHPRPTPPAAYPYYRQAMSAAEHALEAAGVTVLNCSPGSAIDSFPKVRLVDALSHAEHEVAI